MQGNRISRFTGDRNGLLVSGSRDADLAAVMMSESLRQAYESFMRTTDNALAFYDDAISELD